MIAAWLYAITTRTKTVQAKKFGTRNGQIWNEDLSLVLRSYMQINSIMTLFNLGRAIVYNMSIRSTKN